LFFHYAGADTVTVGVPQLLAMYVVDGGRAIAVTVRLPSIKPVPAVPSTNTIVIVTTAPACENLIEILSEVFELGLNGTSTPVLMNSILKTNYYDITFAQDLAVEASFGGSKWGGSNYLDNFKFEGVKSLNSCNILSTTNFSENNITNFSAFPNPTNSVINIKTKLNIIDDFSINLINNLGQIILTQKISTTDFQLDLRNLKATGIYLLTITDKQNRILETKKIIIN
jgi:hypothetical protein